VKRRGARTGRKAGARTDRRRGALANYEVLDEVALIIDRASRGITFVIGVGALVLFSTDTSDAWLLDWRDRYALPLMRGGERLAYRILESARNFVIEWTHDYAIDGDAMVFAERSTGSLRSVIGYPTQRIEDAVLRLAAAAGEAP
jgi:hypothetical protein